MRYILASSVLTGQAGYALVGVAFVVSFATIFFVFRPPVLKGRRTTELRFGQFFYALLSDDSEGSASDQKPKS